MSAVVLNSIIVIILYVPNIFSTEVFMEKFKNYTIYQVTAFNTREREMLYNLYTKVDDMIFLNGISNEASLPMDVLVDNCCTTDIESILEANDIEYARVPENDIISVTVDNGQLYEQLGAAETDPTKNFVGYDAIRKWVRLKIKKDGILEEIKIGQTYEKRDIIVLKLSTGMKNKAAFLMGGEEGRDWTSPAMLLNLINFILTKNKHLDIVMKYYELYILPVFNPDGYMYSMMKERVWSKNSRVYFPKSPCLGNASAVGINIDRNWDFNGKQSIGNEECDPVFSGLKPFSEEETIAVSTFLNKIAVKLMAVINIRGFENLVTIPYGFDMKKCNNYDVLMDIAGAMQDSVFKNHNKTFYYGLSSKYMYNFTGNVADWVKKELNIPIVYTFYMKVESYILPSVKDIEPLTLQLATMVKEVLLLGNIFYGPLFNSQFKIPNGIVILITNICILIVSSA